MNMTDLPCPGCGVDVEFKTWSDSEVDCPGCGLSLLIWSESSWDGEEEYDWQYFEIKGEE